MTRSARLLLLLSVFLFMAFSGHGFQEDRFCSPGTDCNFSFQVRDLYEPGKLYTDLTCQIGIYYPNATVLQEENMSYVGKGFYSYTLNQEEEGSFYWDVECFNPTTGEVKSAKNGIIHVQESVEDSLITVENKVSNNTKSLDKITSRIDSKTEVEITDYHELRDGGIYRLKVTSAGFNGDPKDLESVPDITIYDPERNKVVDSVSASRKSKGVYRYSFNTSSGMTGGIYETKANLTSNEGYRVMTDYWELESSPAQVKINEIVDKKPPEIAANITITNEGNSEYEYHYEYCAVKQQQNLCGGGDDLDYASGAKLIKAGKSWQPELSLDEVNTEGDAWFKLVVYWGSEKSGASQTFNLETSDSNSGSESASSSSESLTTIGRNTEKQQNLKVLYYPENVYVNTGSSTESVIKVQNNNSETVNVSVGVEGLLFNWFDMNSSKRTLEPGETEDFKVEFEIPENISTSNYTFKYVVKSAKVQKREAKLAVMENQEKMLQTQIQELKNQDKKLWSAVNSTETSIDDGLFRKTLAGILLLTMFFYWRTRKNRLLVKDVENLFYTQVTKGTIEETKRKIEQLSDPDYSKLLRKEEQGKDRKGLEEYLEEKLEEES